MIELFNRVLPKDYPELDMTKARVILLESSDEILTPFTPKTRIYALEVLRQRGVDMQLESRVSAVDDRQVSLKDGRTIPTKTLIWAAGVRASPLVDVLGLELDKGFRVKVNPDLSVPDKPKVFVLGDMAGAKDSAGNFYPQVATVAIQQGKYLGKAIKARLQGQTAKDFHYFDKGSMAIIGRNAGIAELSKNLGSFNMRGFMGWLGWLFIHLIYLPGHQNRLSAFMNWAYNYFTFDRHVRLITYMEDERTPVSSPELKEKA
jgi:NADH dehydrogenase